MDEAVRRLLAAAILLALFFGMVGHYDVGSDRHATVDRSYEMLEEGDEHVGETVYVWATVEAASDDELVVRVRSENWTVIGATPAARAGDLVQVHGTIRSGGEIVADRVVVSDQGRRTWMFFISALAAVLTVGRFLRSWLIDPRAVAFLPRGGDETDA